MAGFVMTQMKIFSLPILFVILLRGHGASKIILTICIVLLYISHDMPKLAKLFVIFIAVSLCAQAQQVCQNGNTDDKQIALLIVELGKFRLYMLNQG